MDSYPQTIYMMFFLCRKHRFISIKAMFFNACFQLSIVESCNFLGVIGFIFKDYDFNAIRIYLEDHVLKYNKIETTRVLFRDGQCGRLKLRKLENAL